MRFFLVIALLSSGFRLAGAFGATEPDPSVRGKIAGPPSSEKESGGGGNGKIEDENGSEGGPGDSGERKNSKLKIGPTWGEYGMMAGAVIGGTFAASHGADPQEALASAAGGAIVFGLPFVVAGGCREAFKYFREKKDHL